MVLIKILCVYGMYKLVLTGQTCFGYLESCLHIIITEEELNISIDIIDYVTGIGNLSRDQYIRTRTLCYSLHHFVLSNSIATRPKNGQKPLQLRTY